MIINAYSTTGCMPQPQTPGAAGMDLVPILPGNKDSIRIRPLEKWTFKTGLYLAIPDGYVGFVVPRSSLACKQGVIIPNSPGVIDSDYRGEVMVTLFNTNRKDDLEIKSGYRIAQLIIVKYETVEWNQTGELTETERGKGGYGSTGH
jgi:dUTP pyrophosphatase